MGKKNRAEQKLKIFQRSMKAKKGLGRKFTAKEVKVLKSPSNKKK